MRTCAQCGKEVSDVALTCPYCYATLPITQSSDYVSPSMSDYGMKNKELKLAYILSIVSLVIRCILIIPMIWCIPLFINLKFLIQNKQGVPLYMRIMVTALLSVPGGILLLVNGDKR